MMNYVYIIQSKLDKSFYIGKTSDLKKRLDFHNSYDLNKGITRRKLPWDYYHILEMENAVTAARIERHIKSMKSRKYIENLKKYPEMTEKLLKKYS